uniref:Uncharacterized protein n=1 Tax=Rangifer tarandus platyrhynchus TaxID=3082113 RepID=A0ACB0E3R5_RANTA|nr:unnamed protein product [Rangifer tarandus platyrhynchus]
MQSFRFKRTFPGLKRFRLLGSGGAARQPSTRHLLGELCRPAASLIQGDDLSLSGPTSSARRPSLKHPGGGDAKSRASTDRICVQIREVCSQPVSLQIPALPQNPSEEPRAPIPSRVQAAGQCRPVWPPSHLL